MAEVVGGLIGGTLGFFGGLLIGQPIAGAALGWEVGSGIQAGVNAQQTANQQADLLSAQASRQEQQFQQQGTALQSKQSAMIGASGVKAEGSPLQVMQYTAQQLESDAAWMHQQNQNAINLARQQGDQALATSIINGAGTLLTGAYKLYDNQIGNYGQWTPSMRYY